MLIATCPNCEGSNRHRWSSVGFFVRCNHCGGKYKLTAPSKKEVREENRKRELDDWKNIFGYVAGLGIVTGLMMLLVYCVKLLFLLCQVAIYLLDGCWAFLLRT